MKHLIIAAIITILGATATFATETAAPASITEAPACTAAGNVEATVSDSGRLVFSNKNNYQVTVTWQVYGVRSNGSKSIIGEGTVVLSANDEKPKYFTPNKKEYTSYTVRIQVEKCS